LKVAADSSKLQKESAYLIIVKKLLHKLTAVVCLRTQYITETLSTGYSSTISGVDSVGVVDKATAQSFVFWSVVETGSHTIFNLDPTNAIVSKQSIWKII
jgi:hypothetical protein